MAIATTSAAPHLLTIERRYRHGKRGVITSIHSHLQLPPAWLQAAGFAPGDQVLVDVREGQLILTMPQVQ